MSGPPDRASRPAPVGRPCLRRRSGAHTTPRKTPCPRPDPARTPHGSPSAPPPHHPPSRPTTAVAPSPDDVVGQGNATTVIGGACRPSHAAHGQATPAGCAHSTQHQPRGEDQGAAAGQRAAECCDVEHSPGGEQVQPPIQPTARPRHPNRLPLPGGGGLTPRGERGAGHPRVPRNRDGPAGDQCAPRTRAVPIPGRRHVRAGTLGRQRLPTPGHAHP